VGRWVRGLGRGKKTPSALRKVGLELFITGGKINDENNNNKEIKMPFCMYH